MSSWSPETCPLPWSIFGHGTGGFLVTGCVLVTAHPRPNSTFSTFCDGTAPGASLAVSDFSCFGNGTVGFGNGIFARKRRAVTSTLPMKNSLWSQWSQWSPLFYGFIGTNATPCLLFKQKLHTTNALEKFANTRVHCDHRYRSPKMTITPTARHRRNIARRMSNVLTWWASLPNPKPPCVTPGTLNRCLGIDLQRLAPALRALGWQRILLRVNGRPTTLWLPPSSPITRRPRGRPPLHSYL